MILHIGVDSLDWALNHVERYGDTDIFPIPFEYEAIRFDWTNIRDYLSKKDMDTYVTRTSRRCLSPKHRFGFRISTQLDPLDTLVYLALVYEIGVDIEAKRVPLDRNIVFSYRFAPDINGRLFRPDVGYDSFLKRCREFIQTTEYTSVLVADVADFFPKIYSHPLENALKSLTGKPDHARVIGKLISSWNHTISYGIPVGQTVSRLLAELTISDIDQLLIAEDMAYCRFSDDFRIFCKDKQEAYRALALLANSLFENHGLTLQQQKTHIITKDEFESKYLLTGRAAEDASLSEKFREILINIGIEDWYEEIEYDDLDEEYKKQIDSLNLMEILEEEIGKGDDLDLSLTRFVLRRLGQINEGHAVTQVLKNIELLYPVFKDVICYISQIRRLDSNLRHRIGGYLIKLLNGKSVVGLLEYHRSWAFSIFTHNTEWDNEREFLKLYNSNSDEFSRRELILAMGRAKHDFWFKTTKRDLMQFRPWEKRAFLAAASCLPGDEAKHWYKANMKQLDILEQSIVTWVKTNPF